MIRVYVEQGRNSANRNMFFSRNRVLQERSVVTMFISGYYISW
jgi:hypothetical protein